MKNSMIIILLIVILIGGAVFWSKSTSVTTGPEIAKISMALHKSPTCGCCEIYGVYMRKQGYEVDEDDISDAALSSLKQTIGIPEEIWSCHTSEIEGYTIEGHIPNEAIEKLLAERPDVKGIGMAGMPSGSPGMPGLKDDFMIYIINKDGNLGDLFVKM